MASEKAIEAHRADPATHGKIGLLNRNTSSSSLTMSILRSVDCALWKLIPVFGAVPTEELAEAAQVQKAERTFSSRPGGGLWVGLA